MQTSDHLPTSCPTQAEDGLRNRLIDRALLATAALGCMAFFFSQSRAAAIGWDWRDTVHTAVLAAILAMALFRRRVGTRAKASVLVCAYVLGGAAGVFTLGMLGGGAFFFPVAAAVVAFVCSARFTAAFVTALLLFFCLVAVGFTLGYIRPVVDLGMLLHVPAQWGTYIGSIAICLGVCCMTILAYRREMERLLAQSEQQRDALEKSNAELARAMAQVKSLSGLLPICSACKRIRDDQGYWSQIESYIGEHSDAQFSHGICPDCLRRLYPDCYPAEEARAPAGPVA